MKSYEKTQADIDREESDLKSNAIMRWLLCQDAFKFNPGDIIIKKTRSYTYNPQSHNQTKEWETEVVNKTTGAPKKYVYAFENKLGIGYIRQLRTNGGYCGTLICVANFDPENTKFELDPDFIEHTLIGDGEFEPNTEYQQKKKFREEAMRANKKLLVKTSSKSGLKSWFMSLKPGDEFWYGATFDELVGTKYKVIAIHKGNKPKPREWALSSYQIVNREEQAHSFLDNKEWQTIEVELLETVNPYSKIGSKGHLNIGSFYWKKVTMSQPHPMKDKLCGPPK